MDSITGAIIVAFSEHFEETDLTVVWVDPDQSIHVFIDELHYICYPHSKSILRFENQYHHIIITTSAYAYVVMPEYTTFSVEILTYDSPTPESREHVRVTVLRNQNQLSSAFQRALEVTGLDPDQIDTITIERKEEE